MASFIIRPRLVAIMRPPQSIVSSSSRSFGHSCASKHGKHQHPGTANRPRPAPEETRHPTTPPGPSFVSKGKSPQVQQAEERIPWPISNRNSYFASMMDVDTSKPTEDSGNKPKQNPKEALQSIVSDLRELKAHNNPGMEIEVKDDSKEMILRLTDKPGVSFFRVVALNDDELGFECPSSPGFLRKYKRNEFGEWKCEGDGHNLHGLFVRDLLPHIQGMPRFAMK